MERIVKRSVYGIMQRFMALFFSIKSSNAGKIFMFHQVTNDVTEWKDSEYCITTDAFCSFLNKAENRYKIEKTDNLIMKRTASDAYAFITFDDAFACVYNEAVPILLEKEIPFTVFLTTDLIGKEGYMTREMVETLSKTPLCTIGAHGVSHRMFRNMSDAEAISELRNSKKILSSIIGKSIELFAFPYGSLFACSRRDIKLLRGEGYKMGFSTIKAPLNKRSTRNKYFIPRYNVNQKNYFRVVG